MIPGYYANMKKRTHIETPLVSPQWRRTIHSHDPVLCQVRNMNLYTCVHGLVTMIVGCYVPVLEMIEAILTVSVTWGNTLGDLKQGDSPLL